MWVEGIRVRGYVKLPGSAKDLGLLHIGCVWVCRNARDLVWMQGLRFLF